MPTIDHHPFATASGLAREVYEDINATYGIKEPHGIYLFMGHTPEFLAASWRRSRHLFGTVSGNTDLSLSRFSLKEKHLLTLAVSATNNCEYCVRIHTLRLNQLGTSREELIEALAVTAAANGFDRLAEGTRAGDRPTLPASDGNEKGAGILAEIRDRYGDREPPDLYALLAHLPDVLRAQWELARSCFEEDGHLGLRLKLMLAFAVAATNSTDYYIRRHGARLKELGLGDDDLVELLLVIDLVCGYNRYVQGLQILPETVNTFTPRKGGVAVTGHEG
jgi:AhpD family alkylhydroperoxidase